MTTKYRVIGKTTRPKSKYLLGQYDVPVDAVELARDIAAMEWMKSLLKLVRPESLSENREAGEKEKWRLMNQLDQWLGYARGILKRQYLAK